MLALLGIRCDFAYRAHGDVERGSSQEFRKGYGESMTRSSRERHVKVGRREGEKLHQFGRDITHLVSDPTASNSALYGCRATLRSIRSDVRPRKLIQKVQKRLFGLVELNCPGHDGRVGISKGANSRSYNTGRQGA